MFARLNYLWRLLATGGCFAIFGIGGFALSVLVFPLLRVFPGASRSLRTRWVIHLSFRAFLWLMESVGIMRMDVVGKENLRNCRNVLVFANHPTLIDVVALIALMPTASCVVKQALWDNPFLGGVVRAAGYISNSDADTLIDDCAQDLTSGNPLLLFPEGTRSRPGEALRFMRGAAYVALRSGMPILPVLIDCSPSTLSKSDRWYHIPSRRFSLRIEVLAPLEASRLIASGDVQSVAARKLTKALERCFSRELAKWRR
jgi:1-acyl-sn-glycerol-3-phosphate acyltransferase